MNKLLLGIIITGLIGCLGSNSCHNYYSFEFPTKVSSQDTFYLGDTIWCAMDLPNQLLDRNSGNYIDFSNYELYYSVSISKIDTNIVYDAMSLFKIQELEGRVEQNTNGFISTYVYFKSIGEKQFKFGLIPQQKGTYDMGISLATSFYDIEIDDNKQGLEITDTRCKEYMWLESNALINNGDDNYYLVDGVCQWTTDSLEICYKSQAKHARGGFAFVVE